MYLDNNVSGFRPFPSLVSEESGWSAPPVLTDGLIHLWPSASEVRPLLVIQHSHSLALDSPRVTRQLWRPADYGIGIDQSRSTYIRPSRTQFTRRSRCRWHTTQTSAPRKTDASRKAGVNFLYSLLLVFSGYRFMIPCRITVVSK